MSLPAIKLPKAAPLATNTAADDKPLLEAVHLTKNYGSFQALKGISFDMKPGEIISVLGPSGCGKSTLLQLVAGLAQPDGGQISLENEIIASPSVMLPPEKRGVNMVFQDYALWPHMNVIDNIAYGLQRTRMSKADIELRLNELIAMLHLEGLERRLPPQLSGGQQQRVAIARALATRPRLMLLDEPLSNLDMRLRVEMRTEMAYLFRRLGISVFHVTHDPDEAFAMADRLLILRDGQIDQMGTPQQCFTRPASRWAASLLGAINSLRGQYEYSANGPAVRIGETLISGIVPSASKNIEYGSSAIVMFRPEELHILSSRNEAASHYKSAALSQADHSGNKLVLNVLHCTFEGIRWRTVAETSCGQKLYIVHPEPLEQGDSVTITMNVNSAFIYSNEEER